MKRFLLVLAALAAKKRLAPADQINPSGYALPITSLYCIWCRLA